jgi:hypothetical protein
MQNKLKIASDLAVKLGANINLLELRAESQTLTPHNTLITTFYYNDELFVHSYLYINTGYFGTCLRVGEEQEDIAASGTIESGTIEAASGTSGTTETVDWDSLPEMVTIWVYKSLWATDGKTLERVAHKFGEWYRLEIGVPASGCKKITYMVHESRVDKIIKAGKIG